jgi:hypothetical protein
MISTGIGSGLLDIGELAPAPTLGRDPARPPNPEHSGDGAGDTKSDERSTKHPHAGLPGCGRAADGGSWG